MINSLEATIEWLSQNKEWLFGGVGAAVVAGLFAFFRSRLSGNDEASRGSSVSISESDVYGMVAGRDLHIGNLIKDVGADELVKTLEYRAEKIKRDLKPHYEYAPVQEYLESFSELHERHVAALKNGEYGLAHEILGDIHRLSFELEKEEFWARHDEETPGAMYELDPDAFTRGEIVCGYVAGDFQSYSPRYPGLNELRWHSEEGKTESPYQVMIETAKDS